MESESKKMNYVQGVLIPDFWNPEFQDNLFFEIWIFKKNPLLFKTRDFSNKLDFWNPEFHDNLFFWNSEYQDNLFFKNRICKKKKEMIF